MQGGKQTKQLKIEDRHENETSLVSSSKKLITCEPDFVIFKHPIESNTPSHLVADIELPDVKSQNEIQLDIGEDRLVCDASSNNQKYNLDIFVPYQLNQDECKAEFHCDKKLLKVTMPVLF